MEPLYVADNLEIGYEPETRILICSWKGRQSEELIRRSGEIIYDLFQKQEGCTRILNDNTRKTGHFVHSIEYTAKNWFPRMIQAGLKRFAWVFSEDIFTELSASLAMPNEHLDVIKVFNSYDEAMRWLLSQEQGVYF